MHSGAPGSTWGIGLTPAKRSALRQLVVDAVAPVVAECSATATKPSTDTPNKLAPPTSTRPPLTHINRHRVNLRQDPERLHSRRHFKCGMPGTD